MQTISLQRKATFISLVKPTPETYIFWRIFHQALLIFSFAVSGALGVDFVDLT